MNLLLTNDNDLKIIDGSLATVDGIDEVAQKLKQVLLAVQGDWFLDLDLGLPLFSLILQKATSISAIENTYIDAIAAVPGVLDITKFRLDYVEETRTANITFEVTTSDGVLNYNVEV
jgi:hypothetical protein